MLPKDLLLRLLKNELSAELRDYYNIPETPDNLQDSQIQRAFAKGSITTLHRLIDLLHLTQTTEGNNDPQY